MFAATENPAYLSGMQEIASGTQLTPREGAGDTDVLGKVFDIKTVLTTDEAKKAMDNWTVYLRTFPLPLQAILYPDQPRLQKLWGDPPCWITASTLMHLHQLIRKTLLVGIMLEIGRLDKRYHRVFVEIFCSKLCTKLLSKVLGMPQQPDFNMLVKSYNEAKSLVDSPQIGDQKTQAAMMRIKELVGEIERLVGTTGAAEPATGLTAAKELDVLKEIVQGTHDVGKAKAIVDELGHIFAEQSCLPTIALKAKVRELKVFLNTSMNGTGGSLDC